MSQHVSQWVSNSRDFAARASSRASIATLTRPRRSQSRPSIGRPTDFRHFGGVDGMQSMVGDAALPVRRRRSFRPLELSIYLPDGCGRLSPLPDFEDESTWSGEPAGLEMPAEALVRVRDSRTNSLSSNTSSFLIQRKPVGAGSRRSSINSQRSASTSVQERRLSGTTLATMPTPTMPFVFEESRNAQFSPVRVLSRLPSPSRSRSNTISSRPGSLRRARTDVEDAIRELNTIVEERRASEYRAHAQSPAAINRPPPSPSHHVPSIAPSMRMNVRSETLSDIGSAFSAPAAVKARSAPVSTVYSPATRGTMRLTLTPPTRAYNGALTSNPITPPTQTPTTPIQKFGAWIKRSTSNLASLSQPTTPKTAESFYQCEHPLPSRPSTAGSRTMTHSRQDSQESNGTATVTLFSTSNASTRCSSPEAGSSPSPPRKVKRVPAPLNLSKEKEMTIEAALASARSTRSIMNTKPPMSPNFGILKGMEISAKDIGQGRTLMVPTTVSVGMAF